jgi:hypothetical protein
VPPELFEDLGPSGLPPLLRGFDHAAIDSDQGIWR